MPVSGAASAADGALRAAAAAVMRAVWAPFAAAEVDAAYGAVQASVAANGGYVFYPMPGPPPFKKTSRPAADSDDDEGAGARAGPSSPPPPPDPSPLASAPSAFSSVAARRGAGSPPALFSSE